MLLNQRKVPSASGFLGAYAATTGRMEEILGRLSESRKGNVVRVQTDCGAHRDGDVARSDAPDAARWTLFSGPLFASANVGGREVRNPNSVIVCFDGHLLEPVPEVRVPLHYPAEIVRAAYCKWGIKCLARLNGNYSVVIYDPHIPSLFIARDAAGSKPIYYSFSDHLVFGSSAIDVLRAWGLPAVGDPRGISRYLADGSIAGTPYTLLEGVHALASGHYLSAAPGRRPEQHRVLACEGHQPMAAAVSFDEAAHTLRSLLLENVYAQSAQVRVGVALSGGIDSSGIVASLRSALGPGEPIHAFTFVHAHPALPKAWDEHPWAIRAANHVGAILHPVGLQAQEIPAMMTRIFQSQDFPFSSPVIFAQAQVCRVAAEADVQVMLSGHGPDVIFGGGNSHVIARASGLLRRAHGLAAWRFLQGASHYAASRPERLLLSAVFQQLPALRRVIKSLRRPHSVRTAWFTDRMADGASANHARPLSEHSDPVQRLILEQLNHSTIPTSLVLEECNTRAYGLENRLPYLSHSMIQMACQLPAEYLVSNAGATKNVLRHALTGLVPSAILDRRDRVGFAVPALAWLHELGPWVATRLFELRSLPFYQEPRASMVWGRSSGARLPAGTDAFHIWRWISLLEWVKTHNVTFR